MLELQGGSKKTVSFFPTVEVLLDHEGNIVSGLDMIQMVVMSAHGATSEGTTREQGTWGTSSVLALLMTAMILLAASPRLAAIIWIT